MREIVITVCFYTVQHSKHISIFPVSGLSYFLLPHTLPNLQPLILLLNRYPGATPPKHLKGTMAGDYGFDPLRIGANTEILPYYAEGERINARWAMAAVAGILFTDLVGIHGAEGHWWEADTKTYWADTKTLVGIEIVVMGLLEGLRARGWEKTGQSGAFGMHPFDPAGMNSSEMATKEIKNGRLAMLAFLGFCSQGAVQGLGPIECLKKHLEDPGHNNIFTSSVGPEVTVAVVVLSTVPCLIEAKNSLSPEEDEFRPIPW
jgi:hypothetical protein